MDLKQLVQIYKEIYGQDCVELDGYDFLWTITPEFLHSLDYNNDEFRNVVKLNQDKITNVFYLTDNGHTYRAFTLKEIYEATPSILNLQKKYGVEQRDNEFIINLEAFDKDYIKKRTSDFSCFLFSVWHFCLHLSKYACAFLERGYNYEEELEKLVLFKGEKFENVINVCKNNYPTFAFDEKERLYYILENNEKKYLLKLLDGYIFSSIQFRNEIVLANHTEQKIDLTTIEVIKFLKQALGERFSEKDCSYSSVVYKNGKPLKVYLQEENNVFYFTDKGRAKLDYNKNIQDNDLAKLVDFDTIKNGEIRFYINAILQKNNLDNARYILNKELNRMIFASVDLKEFDFSNIGKFETSLIDYKEILCFLKDKVKANIVENENFAVVEMKSKTLKSISAKFNLEKGTEFCYLTLKNTLNKHRLNKLLHDFKSDIVFFDKSDNKFKTPIYENDLGMLSNKIYNMVQFAIFYKNYKKMIKDNGIKNLKNVKDNKNEGIAKTTYDEIYKKLSKKLKEDSFLGFYVGQIWTQGKNDKKMVLFFFNVFYKETLKVCNLNICKVNGDLIIYNELLINALQSNNSGKLKKLIKYFNLTSNKINTHNVLEKISNMLNLVITAKCLGLVEKNNIN